VNAAVGIHVFRTGFQFSSHAVNKPSLSLHGACSHRANGQVSFRETSRRCHVAFNSSPAIRGHVKQGIAMVYHIFHPRHPLNEERVLSCHSPLSRTRHNQYYAAGVLACARCESATQRSGITFLYRAHCGKMTPSIESEVHNIAQHRQRASEPQP